MRADRNRKGSQKKPQKKLKNRLLLIVVLILIAGVAAEVTALLTMTNIDRRFTRSVERGLYDGWALDGGELQLQTEGRITDTAFIEAEYEAISEYVHRKYKDDELGHLANEYISALNECRRAAARHDPAKDFDEFWAHFSEPYGRRVKALYAMHTGDFSFLLENEEYLDEISNIVAQGWLLDSIDSLSFNKVVDGDTVVFRTRLLNESGCDIEYLDLEIELLNKKGDVVETSSVYVPEVPADEMMDLKFISTSPNAARYRIVSEACRFREPVPEEEEDEAPETGLDAATGDDAEEAPQDDAENVQDAVPEEAPQDKTDDVQDADPEELTGDVQV